MDRRDAVFPDIPLHGYTLETCLGRGTLTTVYRARKPKQDPPSTVLITFLRLPDALSSYTQWHFRERFWKYVERVENLQHPYLLPLVGYGERNTICYFLTDEVSGAPLSTTLIRKTRWSPQEALTIIAPIVEVFTYLHQQHLAGFFFDPAYVQVFNAAPSTSLKLVLASLCLHTLFRRAGLEEEKAGRSLPYEHLQSLSGHYLGQPQYLAPEIIKGQKGTVRSDTYALGILLFTLLSGTPPFVGTHYLEIARQQVEKPLPALHERIPGLPIRLEIVVNQALSRDPNLRFPSPEALLTAYKKSLEEQEDTKQEVYRLFQRVYTLTGTSTRSQASLATPEQATKPATSSQPLQIPTLKDEEAPGKGQASTQEEASKQLTDTEKMHLHLSRMMQRLQQQQEALLTRSQETSAITPAIPPLSTSNAASTEWLN